MNNLWKTVAIVVAWIVFCGISLSNDRFPELIHVVGGVGAIGAIIGGVLGRPITGFFVGIGALIAFVVVGVAIYGVPC